MSCQEDGAEGIRTPDLLLAKEALSQLSYGPDVISDFRLQTARPAQTGFQIGAVLI